MRIHFSVRHLKLTEAIKEYVLDKIATMDRLDQQAIGAHVVLYRDQTHGSKPFRVQVHVAVPGNDLHAEVRAGDLYEAIDLVHEKLETQFRRHKTKLRSKRVKATQKVLRTIRGR